MHTTGPYRSWSNAQTLPDTALALEAPSLNWWAPDESIKSVHDRRCSSCSGGIDVTKSSWVSPVPRVNKPWGHEEHFALVDGRYCGKALHINRGHALSLQYHQQKEETVAVQSGRLLFEVGDPDTPLESFELLPGEAVHLLPGTRHRMTALEDTVVLEASTTELDDVVRLEDRYDRA